jgi:hypothetical protein
MSTSRHFPTNGRDLYDNVVNCSACREIIRSPLNSEKDRPCLLEDLVRIKFNPSDNSLVSQIRVKRLQVDRPLRQRLGKKINDSCSQAVTAYEAAMWAVKAATT